MNRREFITLFGIGSIASSLPIAIAACTSSEPTKTSPSSDWQNIGTVSELDQKGQLQSQNSPIGPVLVVGTSKTNTIAVDPTCPHQGCKVDWQSTNQQFLCPCHQSAFARDGKRLAGPATQPLKTYGVKIENDGVWVKSVF